MESSFLSQSVQSTDPCIRKWNVKLINLADLEFDYINPYDFASRINSFVLPEFIKQGVLCFLYLITGHWVMSLLCVPYLYYNVNMQSSWAPDSVPLSALAVRSLFLTRPSMMHTHPLSQAAQAHTDLESIKTSGSVVLIPDGDQK